MADNAKVLFLRGAQKDVPAAGAARDGVFYLTEDTHRLYVGQGTNPVLLNQTVQIIDNMSALRAKPTTEIYENDFYYVASENILAAYHNGQWNQINPDDYVSSVEMSVDAIVNNTAAVKLTLLDQDSVVIDAENPSETNKYSAKFDVVGGTGVTLTKTDAGALRIDNDTYSLATPVISGTGADAKATLGLTCSDATKSSSVVVAGGDGIKLALNTSNEIVISATNATYSEENGASLDTAITTDGKIQVTLTDSEGGELVGTSEDAISFKVGTTDYIPGQTLPVYTKDEIDTKLKGLDGMTYRGTIGSSGVAKTLPTTGVANGDVYMVSGSMTVPAADAAAGGEVTAKSGDLLIATGTETDGVITANLKWTYVPSGDENADSFSYIMVPDVANHSLTLQNLDGQSSGRIIVEAATANDDISIDYAATKNFTGTDNDTLSLTVAHKTYAAPTEGTATQTSLLDESGVAKLSAITGIAATNGHITGYTTTTFTLPQYDLTEATASDLTGLTFDTAKNTGSTGAKVSLGLEDADGNARTGTNFSLQSSSLKISADTSDTTKVNVELEWGKF